MSHSKPGTSTISNIIDAALVLGGILMVAYGLNHVYGPLAWLWVGAWLLAFGFAGNRRRYA